MPTLRPQRLSGLVVIPTVEHDPGIYRVSIAIDVGFSRVPPVEVVTREDLIVELIAPADGSLEPIASPDPGPLPVRALRVVQARGEFTFGQGQNAPSELKVTVRGDRKSFPMSQTLTPTACLGKEPQEGDPFPRPRPHPRPTGIGLLQQIPQLLPFARPRCCIRRFDAPLNSSTNAAAKSESFEMEGAFLSRRGKCRCTCCEYRQFVRGTFSDSGGASVRFDMPSGALDPARYCEDGAIDEFGPGKHGYYGHRDTSSPGDEYSGSGANQGCSYHATETPSCPPTEGVHLEFLGLVVDSCRGTVVAKRTWTVDL